jgi:hypothetical protein
MDRLDLLEGAPGGVVGLEEDDIYSELELTQGEAMEGPPRSASRDCHVGYPRKQSLGSHRAFLQLFVLPPFSTQIGAPTILRTASPYLKYIVQEFMLAQRSTPSI